MKKFIKLFLLFLTIAHSFTNCSFQLSLFKEVNKDYKNKNLVISPLSIYQVLGLASNGANGATQLEMIDVLEEISLGEINKINTEDLKTVSNSESVEIANAVMSKVTPLTNFANVCGNYNSPLEALLSADQVNSWVNEKTHGKITKMLDELDPNTVMILLNAVYFKGTWKYTFDKTKTIKNSFYNSNSEEKLIKVDKMFQAARLPFTENEEVQVVELPYNQDSMSALIILPKKGIDINEYIKKFDEQSLKLFSNNLENIIVELELPKFEINFEETLNQPLKNLGMELAFDSDKADFSNLTNEVSDIYISNVLHKTFLKVDEEGTEAAGATMVEMNSRSMPVVVSMNVDRPFLFLIKKNDLPENHDLVFMAKIENLE